MNGTPEIRRATGDDAAAIARCYRRAYATAADLGYRTRLTDVDAETIASWLAGDGTTLVAEDDGEVIGTIRLVDDDAASVIERLAVVPERQRDGVATALLDRVEGIARERGDDRLRLTTFADHPFLLAWYERRGYEPIDCPDPSAFTFEFVLLEKSLGDPSNRAAADRSGRGRSDGSAST